MKTEILKSSTKPYEYHLEITQGMQTFTLGYITEDIKGAKYMKKMFDLAIKTHDAEMRRKHKQEIWAEFMKEYKIEY